MRQGRGADDALEAIGRLNASNASARAQERANRRSAVGQLAAYRDLMSRDTINVEDAARILAGVSNKPMTTETLRRLNDSLGVRVSPDVEVLLLSRTAALQ